MLSELMVEVLDTSFLPAKRVDSQNIVISCAKEKFFVSKKALLDAAISAFIF